jgi:predicted dehydrogenase
MKVLIIGYGSIAQKHINALKTIKENVEFVVLRSSKNSLQINEENIKSIFDISDLEFTPNFIIISNPTFLHYQTICNCLFLKCPIIIEKPVLTNNDFSLELSQKILQSNVSTYIACNLRFHPVIKFLKNCIELKTKNIQEVNVYCGSYLPNWRPGKNFKEIYSANEEMGGGVHLDLIHEIDYCIWLFGEPIKTLSVKTSKSNLKISSIDNAIYICEYSNYNININLNYYRINTKRTMEILFEDDVWQVDLIKATIQNSKDEIVFSSSFAMQDTYVEQAKYFLQKIENEEKMMNDFDEATKILQIALN